MYRTRIDLNGKTAEPEDLNTLHPTLRRHINAAENLVASGDALRLSLPKTAAGTVSITRTFYIDRDSLNAVLKSNTDKPNKPTEVIVGKDGTCSMIEAWSEPTPDSQGFIAINPKLRAWQFFDFQNGNHRIIDMHALNNPDDLAEAFDDFMTWR